MALNERQKRFCDEYLIDLDATNAAIRAGYSEKTAYSIGSENLRKPELRHYIDERLEAKNKELIADQDEVMKLISSVLRGEVSGTALVGIGKGAQEVEDVPPTVTEKLKAAELLGKRYAMWTDKQQIDADIGISVVVDYGDTPEG